MHDREEASASQSQRTTSSGHIKATAQSRIEEKRGQSRLPFEGGWPSRAVVQSWHFSLQEREAVSHVAIPLWTHQVRCSQPSGRGLLSDGISHLANSRWQVSGLAKEGKGALMG